MVGSREPGPPNFGETCNSKPRRGLHDRTQRQENEPTSNGDHPWMIDDPLPKRLTRGDGTYGGSRSWLRDIQRRCRRVLEEGEDAVDFYLASLQHLNFNRVPI